MSRRAEEAVRSGLRPGEDVAGGAVMMSDPSRWVAAAFLGPAVALMAAGLTGLVGPQPGPLAGGPAAGFAACLLGAGIQFLPRPVFVAVTSQRLVCLRLSRLRRAPRQVALAVPLAELRIVTYRPGKYASSIQCEITGHQRIRLQAGRAGSNNFAKLEEVLARSGAFAKLDPPWPSAANP